MLQGVVGQEDPGHGIFPLAALFTLVHEHTVFQCAEIAAGELIVREAGGRVEMMADLVATNGHIEI